MRALCWDGINRLKVESVDEPRIVNGQDAIVKILLSAACGSDLHLLDGYIPTMRSGDVIGHEFIAEVVEIGPDVRHRRVGERVVVCSFIACGRCWHCRRGETSLCDNGNPNWGLPSALWGDTAGGCFGYSHLMGGYAGSHAEYVRVPYADQGLFPVPDEVSTLRALFASDAAPTGWMGADLGGVGPGDVVAVWGAGAVGQMAARAAMLLGAERVVVVDPLAYRRDQVTEHIGAEVLDPGETNVQDGLRELSGGRGPDVCIEAVGMEAGGGGAAAAYDWAKQQLRLQTGRPTAVREAVVACRKGGSVFVLGVFGGVVDKFPLGALMNKGLTLRAAQQHGHRYIPMLLERMATGELTTEHFATHVLPLEQGPHGYDLFKHQRDGCVRPVFEL